MNSILFLCVANSARSQMAEGLARQIFGPDYTLQSAGSQPSFVHPLAIQALSELGIETTRHSSKAWHEIELERVDLIITLCAEEICPVPPGQIRRMHWPLPDPAAASAAGQAEAFRRVRDQLKGRLEGLKASLETNGLQPEERAGMPAAVSLVKKDPA